MIETEWIVFFAITFVKTLLIPSYHSTDFEVHRNWLAITHSLPLDEWYIDQTSQWTLDYPPFFAWFERFLAQFAIFFDPNMLKVTNLNYASFETKLFQRFTVIACDLILFYAIRKYSYTWPADRQFGSFMFESWSQRKMVAILIITFLNAGLLMTDHIHFQYNGLLIGIYLLSIVSIRNNEPRGAAFYFAILLNMKHIFLYVAPLYFIYLLSSYVFVERLGQSFWTWEEFTISYKNRKYILRWTHLFSLAFVVLTPFIVSFGPFIAFGQISNLFARLFPFGRGLTHAYWAPNIWALYNFLDIFITKFIFNNTQSQVTRGLVGEYVTTTLPIIKPIHCLILSVLCMIPILYHIWRRPNSKIFLPAALYIMMCTFMMGYHVHEKAILMITIPLSLISLDSTTHAKISFIFNIIANCSLLPLLPNMQETPIKIVLVMMHGIVLYVVLNTELKVYQTVNMFEKSGLNISKIQWLYLSGFIGLQLFYSIIQPIFLPKWQFLPLMLFSVYSAFGCLYCWWKCYQLFFHTLDIVFN